MATTTSTILLPRHVFLPSLFPPPSTAPTNNVGPNSHRSCPTLSNQRVSDGSVPNSRAPARGSSSRPTTLQPSPNQTHFDIQPTPRHSPFRKEHMRRPVLPPLHQLFGMSLKPSECRPGNMSQFILGPQINLTEQGWDRSRRAFQMVTLSPIRMAESQSLPSIIRLPSVDSVQNEHPLPCPFLPHRSFFLPASTRHSNPISLDKSLHTPPATGPHSYPPLTPALSQIPPQAMANAEIRRTSLSFPKSGSTSPIAQYPSPDQYGAPSTPMIRHPSVQMRTSPYHMISERNMVAVPPPDQSGIRLMTIKSQQGRNIQIPVDVQAASKVANEKRRRNAGASARFRVRRKEKGREASMVNSRLKQKLRDTKHDAGFNRVERARYRGISLRSDILGKHSPRLRRSSPSPSLDLSARGRRALCKKT
jgi:hypothetical protein